MKTIRPFFSLLLLSSGLAVAHEVTPAAPTLVVGLSPHLTHEERLASAEGILKLALNGEWNGRVEVFDALRSLPVAAFDLSRAGRLSMAAKARMAAQDILSLRRFLAQETNLMSGDIQLPEFIEHIASQVRRGDEPLSILVIGSALYHGKERGFRMDQNTVPSPDHLSAGARVSPFGTAEKTNHLVNVTVHFIYRETDFTSTFHRKAVDDFWQNFVSLQHGRLISSSWDFKTTFDRIARGAGASTPAAPLAPIGRLCLLKVIGDQLIPVEDSSPTSPAQGVDDLKKQIAALQGQLRQSNDEAAQKSQLAARLGEATEKLARLESELDRAGAERASLAGELDRAARDKNRAQAQAQYDALIAAGDQQDLLPAKLLFERALTIAQANSLDGTVAESRLRTLAEKLAPIQLPNGAVAEILRVSTENYPPCLGLDLAVETADGKPIAALADKDFSVLLNGRKAVVKTASLPVSQTAPPPLNLVIALDCSGSIRAALNQARTATVRMLEVLRERPNLRVKVIAFSKKVEPVMDWTADVNAVAPAMARLKASGNTALYRAISEATADLKRQPGDRRLVVLTDGGDTEGGSSPASLAEAMRREGIVPFFIGLKTAELDAPTLGRMATDAGGFFRMANDAADLADVFSEAGRRLGRQAYRLVLSPSEFPPNESALLTVFVGSGSTTVQVRRTVRVPVVPASTQASTQ